MKRWMVKQNVWVFKGKWRGRDAFQVTLWFYIIFSCLGTFPVGVGDGEENQNNSFHGVLFYKIQQMTHNLMIIIMMSFVFLLIYNRILMS